MLRIILKFNALISSHNCQTECDVLEYFISSDIDYIYRIYFAWRLIIYCLFVFCDPISVENVT